MHIPNTIGVVDNSDMEGFHNIIADVFQVVLVDALVIPLYAFTQIEPNLLLEVNTLIKYQVGIPVLFNTVFLCPIPEIVRG